MRILVFGAESFLGRRLASSLNDAGWASAVECHANTSLRELHAKLDNVDGVVNATMGGHREIEAAARLLYPALRIRAPQARIVQMSSTTVYGTDDGTFDESSPPPAQLGAYALAHLEAEGIALRFERAVVLRAGVEYGPSCVQWSVRVAQWLRQRRLGDLGSGGNGRCNLIYIDDLIAAISAGLRAPVPKDRVFNLVMRTPPTWNQYIVGFAHELGVSPVKPMSRHRWNVETHLFAVPLKVAEIAAARLHIHRLSIPPAIPPSFRRLCAQDLRIGVHRAESQLGMNWTSLAAGLKTTALSIRV
jgi:nucleoside-diphosphate-sugar epimerase